jgi:Peptidase C39 family
MAEALWPCEEKVCRKPHPASLIFLGTVMQIQTGSFVPNGLLEPTGLGCLVIVARHHGLHLTLSQLIHDNMLAGPEVSVAELIKSASGAGLKAKAVHLTLNELNQLKKALPAIVRLEHGGCMVLRRLEGTGNIVRLVLQDPDAGDDTLLLIDPAWFEKVWTGEVIFVERNYASNTIESRPSVPSDLRVAAQNSSVGVPTSLANVDPESPARGDKSYSGPTPALDEARVNLGNAGSLVTRSASGLAEEAPEDIAQAIVARPRRQIRARIRDTQLTANTGSTVFAPEAAVATGVAGQEHTLSQAPTHLIPSSSSTRRFILVAVGAAANAVIVWATIFAIQTPILLSIANLFQTESLKISNVDRREINKTNNRAEIDSDTGPKSKNTNFLSTNASHPTRALDRQFKRDATTETSPAIELKPLPADSVNRSEARSNLRTAANAQQLASGDRISRPEYRPPIQRDINEPNDRTEVASDVGPKSKSTNFQSTNANDPTVFNQRGASTEMSPPIELKPLAADSVNRSEARFNLRTTADVQQPSSGNRTSGSEYQPPIQRAINETNDRTEVASDVEPKSKNTNFLSTNGNDAARSVDSQVNQRGAPTEKLPAIQSKSRRTPIDSAHRSETRFNLRTAADVQQVQQRLVELGYLLFLPDGVWGAHSIQALRAFRTAAGLGSGDQWDRKTEDILFAATAPKATAPTASPLQLPPG